MIFFSSMSKNKVSTTNTDVHMYFAFMIFIPSVFFRMPELQSFMSTSKDKRKNTKEHFSCFLDVGLGEKTMQSKRLRRIKHCVEYC